MRERKTRHRQKCKGGKRETGKRGNMTWVENARLENGAPVCRGGGGENAGPNAMKCRKCNNEQNCKVNNERTLT